MLLDLIAHAKQNPNKDVSLEKIVIKVFSDTNDFEETPQVGPGKVGVIPLDPPGPVSLYLWHNNPEYRAGSFQTRKTILREKIVELNEAFENNLKGRQFNRKKAIEQLQEQESSAVSPPQDTPELNKALCYILNIQYCEVDEIHKKIYFYPSDIRTWSSDKPTYLVSYGSRSIYVKNKEEDARNIFKLWLFSLEDYIISWPTTDGTVKELKELCEQYHVDIHISKPLKEHYSIALGKAQAIKHINATF